jgi:hypothetical protein
LAGQRLSGFFPSPSLSLSLSLFFFYGHATGFYIYIELVGGKKNAAFFPGRAGKARPTASTSA